MEMRKLVNKMKECKLNVLCVTETKAVKEMVDVCLAVWSSVRARVGLIMSDAALTQQTYTVVMCRLVSCAGPGHKIMVCGKNYKN